ncbi:MAG: N-acetyltransferase, partial [Clostridia bacterium]|nr:N-acetyltransferase [Clostridia bacterium]
MKEIKTKRLRIIPLSVGQLESLLQGQEKLDTELGLTPCGVPLDDHLKQAFGEMAAGCKANPNEAVWYTNWQIVLKSENKSVGSLAFMGKPENGSVEVGYGINPAYRGCGYATEALAAVLGWAHSQSDVYFVTAKTEPDNASSGRVLEKCGFRQVGESEEDLLWEKERPASSWMSIYMCFGLSFGLLFGQMTDQLSLGMCIGMPLGLAIGLALDAQDKEKRKKLR